MKIKTSELTGPALNWAVAKCEGKKIFLDRETPGFMCLGEMNLYRFSPTTYWSQGGPIVEREEIDICNYTSRRISKVAALWMASKGLNDHKHVGNTPLVAAMRCYVASKLGEEVEVPEELT